MKIANKIKINRSHSYVLSVILVVLMIFTFTGVASAQNTPTVNGLFYGNGDNLRYPAIPYEVSANGSNLYLTVVDKVLYVALVVDRAVNDNVFDCGIGGAPPCSQSLSPYMLSAGWEESRSAFMLLNSEFAEFTLSLGNGSGQSWTWRQGYAGLQDGGYDNRSANWISNNTVSGGGGTQPPNLISASSMMWNLNNYATKLAAGTNTWTMPGSSNRANSWKSPWNPSNTNTVINDSEGYPAKGNISYSPGYEWEWSMIYEWSIDLSQFAETPVFVVTGSSHHSPSKNVPGGGAQDDEFPKPGPDGPDPLMDFGDLPSPYPTLLADDGARHVIDPNGAILGRQLDPESDGLPHAGALGDDNNGVNDEDGITFLSPIIADQQAKILVSVETEGYLSAFIDFNGDGVLEPVTLLYSSGPVGLSSGVIGDMYIPMPGEYELTIDVPSNASGVMFSRWRYTNEANHGGNSITGLAESGEVEDYAMAAIGNRVWDDINGNGLQDAGEPGVDGVRVFLLYGSGDPVLDYYGNPLTTTTSGGGFYEFSGIMPDTTYIVEFNDIPGGYIFTRLYADGLGQNGSINSDVLNSSGRTESIYLAHGEFNTNIDAGITLPASVGDFVWNDLNADGVQDTGEPGIADVKLILFRPGYGPDGIPGNEDDELEIASVKTSVNGLYTFENLVPGEYYIEVEQPFGYEFSPMLRGGNTELDSDIDPNTGTTAIFTLGPGEDNMSIDAGFYSTSPLPVELLTFTAERSGSEVMLRWVTASETNNDRFEIEYSTNMSEFYTIGSVSSKNSNTSSSQYYNFVHAAPSTGINYYRLKQIDFDGKYEYFQIVTVDFKNSFGDFEIKVYPVPFNDAINVIVGEHSGDYSIVIYDIGGRVVYNSVYSNNEFDGGNHKLNLPDLPSGVYSLQLISDSYNKSVRIIKR